MGAKEGQVGTCCGRKNIYRMMYTPYHYVKEDLLFKQVDSMSAGLTGEMQS